MSAAINADSELRATIEQHRGSSSPSLNLRVWYRGRDGEWKPGINGIFVRPSEIARVRAGLVQLENVAKGSVGR